MDGAYTCTNANEFDELLIERLCTVVFALALAGYCRLYYVVLWPNAAVP
jgi:hypothetical protein